VNTVVITSSIGDSLRRLLDEPRETAAFLYCNVIGRDAEGSALRLLAVELEELKDDDYDVREHDRLTISPIALNRALNAARSARRALTQVHTHPGATEAAFSSLDDAGEAVTIPTVFQRAPSAAHGTLVLARDSWAARIYESAEVPVDARIIEIGSSVRRRDFLRGEGHERYDRTVRVIGRAGQQALQEMRVGIVGVGGTGSHVAQQLAYLGVRDVAFVDDDAIELTNLNRVITATPSDIGLRKVDVAAHRYRDIEHGASVRRVFGDVMDEETARSILDRDVIFSCTDSVGSRAVLNWLSYQYLIPVIDLAVDIREVDDAPLVSGRLQLIGPGTGCLSCAGLLDANQVRIDLMTEEERRRDRYVVDADVVQPAVVSINGVVASLAVTMFLAMTTGLPLDARRQTYFGNQGAVRVARSASLTDCPVCDDPDHLGSGEATIAIWRRKKAAL
jgi:molybdopterin/thiamine biosynthesis adenylyltransferase